MLNLTEPTGGFEWVVLENLVRMKLVSFRGKDPMHLRGMASVRLIDESWPCQRLLMILNDP